MRGKTFLIRVIILFMIATAISIFLNYYYSLKYQTIDIDKFSYLIPDKLYENSSLYTSDHMFKLEDNNGEYQVYGTIINNFNEEDEILGCFNAEIDVNSLIKKENRNEIGKVIANNSDVLTEKGFFPGGQDRYARYFRYYYTGKGKSKYQDYNTLIFYCKMYDQVSIEVFLYKDYSLISQHEIKDMFRSFEFDIP